MVVRGGWLALGLLAASLLSGCSQGPGRLDTEDLAQPRSEAAAPFFDVRGWAPTIAAWDLQGAASDPQAIEFWYARPGSTSDAQYTRLERLAGAGEEGTSPIPLPAGDWLVRMRVAWADGSASWTPPRPWSSGPVSPDPPRVDAGADVRLVDGDGDGWEQVTLAGLVRPGPGQAIRNVTWSLGDRELANAPVASARLPIGTHRLVLNASYAAAMPGWVEDHMTVTVAGNTPPTVAAWTGMAEVADANGDGKEVVLLRGSASDAERPLQSVAWRNGGMTVLQAQEGNATFPVGTHSLTFEATDAGGQRAQSAVQLVVRANQAPLAAAGPDQVAVDEDGNGFATVTLDARGSRDPEGSPLGFRWAVGGQFLSNAALVAWEAPVGTHEVTLQVTDPAGEQSSDALGVSVRGPLAPFVAGFQASCDGLRCVLDATESRGEAPLQLRWTVDGASVAEGTIVTHTFPTGGTYVVGLQVTDAAGRTGFAVQEVEPEVVVPVAVSSPAFADGGEIPEKYGCRAAGMEGLAFGFTGTHRTAAARLAYPTPPLQFTAPAQAKYLAFTVVDTVPDFAHWAVWDVPMPASGTLSLAEGAALPAGSIQGTEDVNGGTGYFPICGFRNTGVHPFVFTVYGLREPLGLPSTANRAALVAAITPANLVATATYVGTYENHVCDPLMLGLLPAGVLGSTYGTLWPTFWGLTGGTAPANSNGMSSSCLYGF